MAKNKIERIDQEIEKTREKIVNIRKSSRPWKHRKRRQRIWKSFRWFVRYA